MVRSLHYLLFCLLTVVLSLAIVTALILAPGAANAAIYHVSKSGSNGNSCRDALSRSKSKLTINEGLKCLSAGDTLYIGAGTYEEGIDSTENTIPSGTSWNNAVTIAAAPGEQVTLRPRKAFEVISLIGSQISYLVFDGLILDAENVTTDGFSLTNGAHHVKLQNSEVKNAPNQGILISKGTGSTDYNEFRNLSVHDNGRNKFSHGIYISTSNNLIEGCKVYRNSGYGIHLYDDTGEVNSNIVRLNTTWSNSWSYCCGAGILVGSGRNNIAYNNISYNNGYGITSGYNKTSGAKIYNNTVYKNIHGGIQNLGTSIDAVIKNNIAYRNPMPIENHGSNATLSHNLTSDPQFVNDAMFDFRLQPSSPAIDSGEPINEVTIDIRGISRTKGKGPDVGAHEFDDSTSSYIPAPSNLQVKP